MMPHAYAQVSPIRRYRPWQWATVVLLSALSGALVTQALWTSAEARAQTTTSGKDNVFAMAGQLSKDNYGIFLVDSGNSTMAIYEWVPDRVQGRMLRLVATRNFAFDLQLDDYNNAAKTPREIKEIAEKQKRLDEVRPQK